MSIYLVNPRSRVKATISDPEIINLLRGGSQKTRLTTEGAYSRQGWLRRCVNVRAWALGQVPWVITETGREPDNPNDVLWSSGKSAPEDLTALDGLDRIMVLFEASRALTGQAYAFIHQDRGTVTGLQYQSPATITPVIMGSPEAQNVETVPALRLKERQRQLKDGISHFWRSTGTGRVAQSVLDTLYVFDLNPYAEAGPGQGSDGIAATDAAGVLHSLEQFMVQYFDRGLIKATLLTVPQGTAPEERVRVESWWKRWFSGRARMNDQKVIEADGIKPVTVGEGIKDLSNTDTTQEEREHISTALGVPHSIVMSNAANFATASQDVLTFLNFTVLPGAGLIGQALNAQVLNPMGLHLHFMPKKMEAFVNQELQKAQAVSQLVGGPVITREEGRGMLDLGEPKGEFIGAPMPATRTARDLDGHQREELAQWRRKARKNREANFECNHLPASVQSAIKVRLALGDAIDTAFSPPFPVAGRN